MSLAVVGAIHDNKDRSNRLFEIQLCAPGEPVDLVPEPKNPFDPSAIAIFSVRGIQIGYVSAEKFAGYSRKPSRAARSSASASAAKIPSCRLPARQRSKEQMPRRIVVSIRTLFHPTIEMVEDYTPAAFSVSSTVWR